MPAIPGESLLTTLFADVHYYFGEAAAQPRHHRFDRGSYVYIYHNASSNQAKIEVANHAGTADQDAVSGYLGSSAARVDYSYKQPTLFTVTIPPSPSPDSNSWHLPAFDPHNKQKYLYCITQIDIYLWTEKDASEFLRHIKSVVSTDRLNIRDVPANLVNDAHSSSMSHVVQQLEKTAIGSQFPPRAGSAVSQLSFPGPPTPAASGGAASPQPPAPGGYNPAAPAAPEPIVHREKTPPPPDDGSGTGLKAAAKYDSVPQHQPYQGYQSAVPQRQSIYGGFPPPPPGGLGHQSQHSLSFSGPPSSQHTPQPTVSSIAAAPPPPPGPPPPQQQSFQASFLPAQTQYASYPQQSYGQSVQSPGLPPTPSAPPAYAGHTPLQSPGLPPPPASAPPQQQHFPQHFHQAPQQQYNFQQQQQQQQSNFQYSNYEYTAAQNPSSGGAVNSQGAYTGNLHAQAYRPTAVEATHGYYHHSSSTPKPQTTTPSQSGSVGGSAMGPGEKQPKLSQLDKKVGGFLKRLDKMI